MPRRFFKEIVRFPFPRFFFAIKHPHTRTSTPAHFAAPFSHCSIPPCVFSLFFLCLGDLAPGEQRVGTVSWKVRFCVLRLSGDACIVWFLWIGPSSSQVVVHVMFRVQGPTLLVWIPPHSPTSSSPPPPPQIGSQSDRPLGGPDGTHHAHTGPLGKGGKKASIPGAGARGRATATSMRAPFPGLFPRPPPPVLKA